MGDDCGVWYGAVLRGDVGAIRIGDRVNIQDNAVLSYNFPIMAINDAPCLYIYDSDIEFVIKEFEMVNEAAEIVEETAPEIV